MTCVALIPVAVHRYRGRGRLGETGASGSIAYFVRASRRLHYWLINHAVLGPIVLAWREYRATFTACGGSRA
jgi:hypothetical protein